MSIAAATAATAVAVLVRWLQDPVAFVRECLGAEPDAWQVEVLEALVKSGFNRFCLKASKGPGKTTILAWAILWFLATRMHPKVVCTSITEDNLKDGLWSELSKWQQCSPFLQAAFTWRNERFVSNEFPQTWWASARTWPKGADASQQANTLAGVHADNVLFVIDEAGGVPDAVAAAAEGGLANASKEHGREALLIIAGNPTHLEGPLYRACTSERALWWVKEISGDPDDPKRAPRVDIEWARAQIAKYGRDNPFVLVNVFGQFPPSSSNALMGPDVVQKAMKRVLHESVWGREVKVLGVDIARFGDDRSVLVLRQGPVVHQPVVIRNLDTMALAGRIALYIEEHQPDGVFLDQATFGMGAVDRLQQLGFPVMGIDFGGKATSARYANMRAEMWFKMSEWVKANGCLPDMPELVTELTTPLYKFNDENRLQLERKAEIKKRTGCSPDIADAIALTFAHPVAARDMQHLLQSRAARRRAETDFDPFRE